MRAFFALVHREFLEHRGAFFTAPLILVGVLFGATVLGFTVGRVDAKFSGAIFHIVPIKAFEAGFLGFSFAWSLYLAATLFFYCADGFSADRRNNAMLFWKSMPVSDLRMLLAKLAATLTIFPAMIFGVFLLSGVLLLGVITVTSAMGVGLGAVLFGSVLAVFANVALATLATFVFGLLWYLPWMALIGALGAVIGRWAIPLSLLLPTLVSVLEWVTFGGLTPFHTRVWSYLSYRIDFPVNDTYLDKWMELESAFDAGAFVTVLLGNINWTQMAIGWAFGLGVIYLASEYRRRRNDN